MGTWWRRNGAKLLLVSAVGLGGVMTWMRWPASRSRASQLLRITRPRHSSPPTPSAVIPDDLRLKYPPDQRGDFHLVSAEKTAVAVWETGVQTLTPSGWKVASPDQRGEIWRLQSGLPREFCVERPTHTTWRAYIRYGREMKGPALWWAQVREVWKLHSFSNWTGKAWGGGRFAGNLELFSEVIEE